MEQCTKLRKETASNMKAEIMMLTRKENRIIRFFFKLQMLGDQDII